MSTTRPAIRVQIDRNPSPVLRFAAAELRGALKTALGTSAITRTGRHHEQGLIIRMGGSACRQLAAVRPRLDARRRELAPEGFVLKRIGSELLIAGRDDSGTLRGTHAFIERCLGVRWYFPDHPIAPKLSIKRFFDDLSVQLQQIEEPNFPYRRLDPATTDAWLNWAVRNRFNTIGVKITGPDATPTALNRLGRQCRQRGLQLSAYGHAYQRFLLANEYFGTHPEWFALVDGQRTNRQRQVFCTSCEPAMSMFLDNLRRYIEETPDIDRFELWPEDGCVWCQCPQCSKTSKPDRYVNLINAMARTIWSLRPNMPCSLFAYGTHRQLPDAAIPDRNLQIMYCWWGRNYGVPFDHDDCAIHHDETYNDSGHPACCVQLQQFRDWVDRFGQTNEVILYDQQPQQSIRSPSMLPIPHLDDDYRWFKSQGLSGLVLAASVHDHGWVSGLNLYASGRMLWDGSAKRGRIIDDFFDHYYRQAAGLMKQLYTQIDRGFPHNRRTYHATLGKARNFNLYGTWSAKPQRRYPADLKAYNRGGQAALNRCRRLLARARPTSLDRQIQVRLEKVEIILEYLTGSCTSIAKQMEAADQIEAAMQQDVRAAVARLRQVESLYRQVCQIEAGLARLMQRYQGQGLFWDGNAWSTRVWQGQSRIKHFPRGIINFTRADGKPHGI